MQRRTLVTGALAAAAGTALVTTAADAAVAGPGTPATTRTGPRRSGPTIIAHRGASGYRPEHTLAAYRLAIALGADFIEPDLVSTKDGRLVARHENEISGTTDVARRPEFAARKATRTIDGVTVTGWFTEDFTLAELKTLRAVERLPAVRVHNTLYDGLFQVPTFEEVIELAKAESKRLGRTIGVYPETKHPTYFDSIGKGLEGPLVQALHHAGWSHRKAPMIVQSFETGNLRRLRNHIDTPIAQLLDASGAPYDLRAAGDPRTYADLVKPDGLARISDYADGVGANKNWIIPRDAAGNLGAPSTLVADAHRRNLIVHAWTFRNENQFLAANHRRGTDPSMWGDAFAEYKAFFDTGLDGLFSDFPDTAVQARELYVRV